MADRLPAAVTPALASALAITVAGAALLWWRWAAREPALERRTQERLG